MELHIKGQDTKYGTALKSAIVRDQFDRVEVQADHGANPDNPEALAKAAANGLNKVVGLLLNVGVHIDVDEGAPLLEAAYLANGARWSPCWNEGLMSTLKGNAASLNGDTRHRLIPSDCGTSRYVVVR